MSNETKNLYRFGKFRFDGKANALWRENELIPLSPKALELLKLLIEKRGEIASKQEIFEKVWANTFVEEGVLTQNIYTLRQALGTDENGKQLIENLARRGYRLTIPVELETAIEPKESKPLNSQSVEPLQTQPVSNSLLHRFALPLLIIGFIAVIGFFSFRYFASKNIEPTTNSSVQLNFERITDTGDASYLTISPDGNLVAYTRVGGVFLKNLATGEETKINFENAPKVGCLQFSPDGNWLYFGSLTNRDEKGSVYRVSVKGGTPEIVSENVWSGFSLSPDGKNLALVRKFPNDNKQSLIIVNLETRADKPLKTLNLPDEFYWNNYPAWSADGKQIGMIVVSQTEHFRRILALDLTGGEREIKTENFRNVEQIVWNSASDSFIASANDGKNFQLWKVGFDGSAKRLTNDLNSYLGISVSADRKKLASRQRIYFSNIWTAKKSDLNNLKQLTTGTSRNDGLRGLRWLDEEKIVYASNDEKIRDWNLWLLNANDGSKQKLTADSETQNDYPAVSPDKKWIYFSSDRNKESRIWRIDADGKNPLQITFGEDETHHFPQISPDGNHLYFIIKSGRNSTIGRKSLQENSVQELSGKMNYSAGNFLSLSPDGKFLAFQNINYQEKSQLESPKLQIAFLSTEDPQKVEFKEINAWQQKIEWTSDSKSFEYVGGNYKNSTVVRRFFSDTSASENILTSNESVIFNFAWSPSGENLALARGQLLRDVVLIKDFE